MRTRIYHIRKVNENGKEHFVLGKRLLTGEETDAELLHKGGGTIAIMEDGDRRSVGIAICSDLDPYNKKIGSAIARGRANYAMKHTENGEEGIYHPITGSGSENVLLELAYSLLEA